MESYNYTNLFFRKDHITFTTFIICPDGAATILTEMSRRVRLGNVSEFCIAAERESGEDRLTLHMKIPTNLFYSLNADCICFKSNA